MAATCAPRTAPTASRPTRGVFRTCTSHADSLPPVQCGAYTRAVARRAHLPAPRARRPAGRAATSARHCMQLGWRPPPVVLAERATCRLPRGSSAALARLRTVPLAPVTMRVCAPGGASHAQPYRVVSLALTRRVLRLPSTPTRAVVARTSATQRAASSAAAPLAAKRSVAGQALRTAPVRAGRRSPLLCGARDGSRSNIAQRRGGAATTPSSHSTAVSPPVALPAQRPQLW